MNPTGDPPVQDDPIPEPPQRYPFWNYEDLAMFGGMVLPAVLLAALLITAGKAVAPAFFSQPIVRNLGSQLLTYVLLFGGLSFLFRARYGQTLFHSLGWIFSVRGTIWPILIGPLLAISIAFLGSTFRTPVVPNPFEGMLEGRVEIAVVGFFAVIIGPLAEELAFRGFLLPLLARSFGVAIAVIGTALAFALLHGPQYSWSWQYIVLVGSAGAVFGVARVVSRSTASAFLMHAMYNLTFFALYLLQTQLTRNRFPEPI